MPEDIFISYAHIDDRPFGDTKGWVTNLHERLKVRLAQLLGAEPSIWWDGRLQGDQYFAGEIGDRVGETELLVTVVTPRYVNSTWCRGELREFCERAARRAGEARNHSRIFKVVKTPVPEEHQPDEVRNLLGYLFYEFDANERPREFSASLASDKDPKYWARLDDLAWEIKKAVERLRAEAAKEGDAKGAAGGGGDAAPQRDAAQPLEKKVYLAETTADLAAERDLIRRELQQRTFYVLPDRELPLTAPEFEAEVREQLARCALSVHLVGASYGIIPEGEEERSILRWQEELAAERSRADAEFTRLVWMPKGLEPKGARQRAFIDELQTSLGAGAELLQTSVEALKTRVLEKLLPPPKPAAAAAAAAQGASDDELKRVYLICDNRDLGEVEPIEEFLFNQGYEVLPSIDGADGAEIAQYHRESLLACDAALIYYGNANQLWLRAKMGDLQKAQGWGRTAPMLTKGVYVSGPATPEKQRFRTREVPVVMENYQGFSPDALQPFLHAMRAGNGGQR
jgi:hypothetical protein